MADDTNDTKWEPGCGYILHAVHRDLVTLAADQYLEALKQLPRLSARSRDDLAAGFRDGMRAAIQHLIGMGAITIHPPLTTLDGKRVEK